MTRLPPPRSALALLSLLCVACGSDDDAGAAGKGSLTVLVTGEAGAEEGFPFTEDGETVAFEDGTTLRFSKFLASVGNVSVASADGTEAARSTRVHVVDLHLGHARLEEFTGLGARRWDRFGYEILPPPPDAVLGEGVSAVDAEAMRTGGFNYWVEGTATLTDGAVFTFAWGLRNPTRNQDCTSGIDETQGVVVRNNSTAEAEITLHVDHLFWDSLGTEGASLRFEGHAAAGGDDGVITWAELEAVPIASVRDRQGNLLQYDTGSVSLSSPTLAGFLLASSSSMGHLDGEGLCMVRAR